MFDHLLRKPKQKLLAPLARRLAIAPNGVTAAGLVVGLLGVYFTATGDWNSGLKLWLCNRILDGLDGEIARAQNTHSDLGGYLDMMADLTVYALIPLALALSSSSLWAPAAFMLGAFYLNLGSWMYLSSILEKRGLGAQARGESTQITMPKGLIEGGETVIFYTLFYLLPKALPILFITFGCLTLITALQRIRWASLALGHNEKL